MVAITDQNGNSLHTKVIYSHLIILSIDVHEHYYRKLKGIENWGQHLEQYGQKCNNGAIYRLCITESSNPCLT